MGALMDTAGQGVDVQQVVLKGVSRNLSSASFLYC